MRDSYRRWSHVRYLGRDLIAVKAKKSQARVIADMYVASAVRAITLLTVPGLSWAFIYRLACAAKESQDGESTSSVVHVAPQPRLRRLGPLGPINVARAELRAVDYEDNLQTLGFTSA